MPLGISASLPPWRSRARRTRRPSRCGTMPTRTCRRAPCTPRAAPAVAAFSAPGIVRVHARQRALDAARAERRVADAGDRDARGGDRAAAQRQRRGDADDRVVRGGVVELDVRRVRRGVERDRGEDLAGPERGLEHPAEELGRGEVARAALARQREGRVERLQYRRIVGRGIAVGRCSADRPAVANLRIAEIVRSVPQHRRVRAQVGAGGERGVLRQRADRHAVAARPKCRRASESHRCR